MTAAVFRGQSVGQCRTPPIDYLILSQRPTWRAPDQARAFCGVFELGPRVVGRKTWIAVQTAGGSWLNLSKGIGPVIPGTICPPPTRFLDHRYSRFPHTPRIWCTSTCEMVTRRARPGSPSTANLASPSPGTPISETSGGRASEHDCGPGSAVSTPSGSCTPERRTTGGSLASTCAGPGPVPCAGEGADVGEAIT